MISEDFCVPGHGASLALPRPSQPHPDLRTHRKRAQTQLQPFQEVCGVHRASGSHQKSFRGHRMTAERNFCKSLIFLVFQDFSWFLEICEVSATAPHGSCIALPASPGPPNPSQTLANATVDIPGSLRRATGHQESIRNHLGGIR